MKIAVLLSGGVDSSVALALLARREPRAELTAYYLKIWLEDELAFLGECPWEDDLRHARAVAERLSVPLEIVPLQAAYQQRVVAHALAELGAGRTPSPDVHCNERVKFGAFFEAIGDRHDRVATGHYAQVRHDARGARLVSAMDAVKDQTYFLARLSQAQLARAEFPIGHMPKPAVRSLAHELGLVTHDRKDSQGICFLGRIPYPEFVHHHLGPAPGDIVDVDGGRVLGRHEGLWFHTIGQRKGLGLGGGPWFVVAKDIPAKTLYVAHADRLATHERADFEVDELHWLAEKPALDTRFSVKLRHGPRRVSCRLEPSGPATASRLRVRMQSPDPGIAPGQFAVFYRDDDEAECLGSGVIH